MTGVMGMGSVTGIAGLENGASLGEQGGRGGRGWQ